MCKKPCLWVCTLSLFLLVGCQGKWNLSPSSNNKEKVSAHPANKKQKLDLSPSVTQFRRRQQALEKQQKALRQVHKQLWNKRQSIIREHSQRVTEQTKGLHQELLQLRKHRLQTRKR